jgi:hypothetical protein
MLKSILLGLIKQIINSKKSMLQMCSDKKSDSSKFPYAKSNIHLVPRTRISKIRNIMRMFSLALSVFAVFPAYTSKAPISNGTISAAM